MRSIRGQRLNPNHDNLLPQKLIDPEDWSEIIQHLSSSTSVVARLLINEVPENIEYSFLPGQYLLPHSRKDFITKCTCPDYYSDACKHIAGLCYRLAKELDQSPFLLFELRGLSKEALLEELIKSPLGKILASELDNSTATKSECSVSAIVIKKQGDYPPFWTKDQSFIETMEELYDRVKTKNSGLL